ncbi:MAG: hypothetical protein IT378_22130 [Sandaracinaceae bacterium]|nr:hypothetical protein [Sandaracinaceae bacterium]
MNPAPHVPVNFLKAGGAAFFSARCIALLLEYEYNPDEFGTYDSTAQRLSQARQEVADWEARGRTPPHPDPRTMELGRPMSDPDHYESGHLMMNTTMQGTRGDPCTNFTLGHADNLYPCMPHQGGATDPGSEHNRWTCDEVDVPNSRGAPRSTYPGSEMEMDADRRTAALLRRRQEELQAEGRGQNLGRMALGTEAERQQALAEAEAARAAALGGREALPPDKQIDGSSAAECINNFRKGGAAGLRSHAADEETIQRNEALARGENPDGTPRADMPPRRPGESPEDYRARLRSDAAAAEAATGPTAAELESANRSAGQYDRRLREERERYNSLANPTREDYERLQERQRRVDEANERCRAAERAHAETSAAAGAASGASTRAESANCRANQGRALQANPDAGRDGRRPAPWPDLPRPGGGGGDGGTVDVD